MEAWLAWGIPLIVGLQALGDWLLVPMRFFSLLGSEAFYLLIMPSVLWCLDPGIGLRMGLVLLTSASINNILKLTFGWPRPYWVSDQVRALAHEGSFGMPSGHAQNALAVWGILALQRRRMAWGILLGALILAISLSRLYLGVHFPSDVIGGWLVGAIVLLVVTLLERPFEAWLFRQPPGLQLLSPMILSLGLLAAGLLVADRTAERIVPGEWTAAAAAAFPDEATIDPKNPSGIVSASGSLLGLGVGAVLLRRWGRFRAAGPVGQRLLRLIAGLAGIMILYYGLGALRPHGVGDLSQALRFVNYAAVGLWIAFGAPWAFVRLKLA